jgi:hypothetical protein
MPVLLRSRSISLEHVHATEGFWNRIDRINERADFARALVRHDPLACSQIRHVEECIIFYPRRLNLYLLYFETNNLALSTIIRTLPCTIKSLSLQNVAISSGFFMVLRALTNLESLALSSVVLSSEFVSNQTTIRLDLKSFSLFPCEVDQLSAWESLSTFLNLDSIRILRIDNRYFLDAVVSQCKALNMMCLEHNSNIMRFNYLAQMPYLLTLNINTGYTQTYAALDLSPMSMPKLQNLRCPVFLAQYIIPGRPLKNIDIYSFSYIETNMFKPSALLRLIQLSTASIKKLHVPTSVYLESPHEFGNTFPDLDELSLTLRSESDVTNTVRNSNSSAIINN